MESHCSLALHFLLFTSFESRSCCVSQADLEVVIFLPQPPGSWNDCCVLPRLQGTVTTFTAGLEHVHGTSSYLHFPVLSTLELKELSTIGT